MKVYLLQYEAGYDGQILLGIYNDKQLAQEALQDYASLEDNKGSEPFLEIIEVSMNDKPNWYFTNPELQAHYQND